MPTLDALYYYPIKSIAGITLDETSISPLGLPHDRAWMVSDLDGRLVTGREHPELVQVHAEVGVGTLTLRAPGLPELVVDLAQFEQAHPASVWKDNFSAWAGAAAADDWFSQYLGRPVRLLATNDTQRRVRSAPDVPLSFADGYPLLLIGEASRRELSDWVGRDLAMARFRPNLVINDAPAFAEDGWKRIRIGDVILRIAKPCGRCVFTTVDPVTAQKSADQEPLRTLAKRRKGPEGAEFGQNVIAETSGVLRVGMPVEILE
ncbi:MOSC domain-containing protein [Silvimonas sp. JCM 19000]